MAIPAPEPGFPHQVRHSNFLQTPLYSNKCQLRATFCPAIKKDVGILTDRQPTAPKRMSNNQRALLSTYDATATNFLHFHTLRRLAKECMSRDLSCARFSGNPQLMGLSQRRPIAVGLPPVRMSRKRAGHSLSKA